MMNKCYRAVCIALLTTASFCVNAGDKVLYLDISDVLSPSYSHGKLDGTVKFHFAGQVSPKITRTLDEGITNRKTNGFGKGDSESCKWVMLSALIALQQSAKAQGANAVVNITSYYNRIEYKSGAKYECHAGFTMSGVALKGNYAIVQEH